MSPSFWLNRRVALTGHTGFKGSWLALWLDELGAEVHGYALAAPAPSAFRALAPNVRSTIGDVRDRDGIAAWLHSIKPEIVFHLAAQPIVRASYADPVGTFDTNVTGTLNLLEAARSVCELRAMVVITSDKAYAPASGRPLDETAHLGGSDPYSASKSCTEIITHSYAQSFPSRAILATARAGNVIGGGDWSEDRLIPDLVRALRAGTLPLLRYPDAIRPWQHVLEPLAGYLLLAERAANGDACASGAFNFGPFQRSEISVAEVIERAMRAAGHPPAWRRESATHAELAALRIDSRKAQVRLGWQPLYDIDEAISATMNWYARALDGADMAAFSRAQIADYMRRSESLGFFAHQLVR
jgi:CDP-glucose 4,6-dehydratase